MELKGKKINFLGDSITQGVGTSAPEKMYHQVLKEMAGLAEARNYGVSGSKIARPSNGVPLNDGIESFYDRFAAMDDDADVIVIFGGTNDYGWNIIKIGEFTDRTPYTFYGALHLMAEGLMNKYPEAKIVFMTPTQTSSSPNPDRIYLTPYGNSLLDFANAIKKVCEFYSFPCLDLYSMAGIHPSIHKNAKAFCPDGLHPNDAGNAIIASRLFGFLKAL